LSSSSSSLSSHHSGDLVDYLTTIRRWYQVLYASIQEQEAFDQVIVMSKKALYVAETSPDCPLEKVRVRSHSSSGSS